MELSSELISNLEPVGDNKVVEKSAVYPFQRELLRKQHKLLRKEEEKEQRKKNNEKSNRKRNIKKTRLDTEVDCDVPKLYRIESSVVRNAMKKVERYWSLKELSRKVCACCDVVSKDCDVKGHVLNKEFLDKLRVRLKWLDGIHEDVKKAYSVKCNSFPLLSDFPLSKKGMIVNVDEKGKESVDVVICVKC